MMCVSKVIFIRTCEHVYICVSTDHLSVLEVKAVGSHFAWNLICSLLFPGLFPINLHIHVMYWKSPSSKISYFSFMFKNYS